MGKATFLLLVPAVLLFAGQVQAGVRHAQYNSAVLSAEWAAYEGFKPGHGTGQIRSDVLSRRAAVAAERYVLHTKEPVNAILAPPHAAKAAAGSLNSADEAARAAMKKAINPSTSGTQGKTAAKPKPAKPATAAAPEKVPLSSTVQEEAAGNDHKALEQQWADAFSIHAANSATTTKSEEAPRSGGHDKALRSRQGLVSMPKGMSSVKRDGASVLGDTTGAGNSKPAAGAGTAQAFHARAAAAVLEAYLGKHGGTESHALLWICIGAAMVLGAVVALIVSELSVVTLVRKQAEQADMDPLTLTSNQQGAAGDFSRIQQEPAALPASGFGRCVCVYVCVCVCVCVYIYTYVYIINAYAQSMS